VELREAKEGHWWSKGEPRDTWSFKPRKPG